MAHAPKTDTEEKDWLQTLRSLVERKPLLVLRFSGDEWYDLENSYHGLRRFTVARSRSTLRNVHSPTACILFAKDHLDRPVAYFALLKKLGPGTTLERRITIERAHKITPATERGLRGLVSDKSLATILDNKLSEAGPVVPLSPKLSSHLIDKLAERRGNSAAMKAAIGDLDAPSRYSSNDAIQQDAVSVALRTFGINHASVLETTGDTALGRVNIREDAVIEHDARTVPEFELIGSDFTGRAIFEDGVDRLEVITANKRPLEQVLGVDLVYFNATKQNIVMVQYKMLEPLRDSDETDWIYYPDADLEDEIARMQRFSAAMPPGPLEYRINPQVYFLKFVRRDAALGRSSITIPIDHFNVLRADPECKGPRGAFRISYDTLAGRYLRQDAFIDLLRSGYIGAHAETTNALIDLVNATLDNDRAVVAAVQTHIEREDGES
ncbi:MAG: hypothetical protein R3E82_11660 [Pseudomonadales bacterium]